MDWSQMVSKLICALYLLSLRNGGGGFEDEKVLPSPTISKMATIVYFWFLMICTINIPTIHINPSTYPETSVQTRACPSCRQKKHQQNRNHAKISSGKKSLEAMASTLRTPTAFKATSNGCFIKWPPSILIAWEKSKSEKLESAKRILRT